VCWQAQNQIERFRVRVIIHALHNPSTNKPPAKQRVPLSPQQRPSSSSLTMDSDLIKLVNKLQDTFANLGRSFSVIALMTNPFTAKQVESWICHSWSS
jgi:hypothetical protein